ncbi:JAB domain-containing protein [Pedobacter sp. G11]|uniref:JAB domain-containing protein n=1 Tax=Pedobacter sp. G11 TaxID=2482728 RepID=UPI00352FE2AC
MICLNFSAKARTKAVRYPYKILFCDRHPSGNLRPSEADKLFVKKLKEGGKLSDIEVCDHIIVTNRNYVSFADEC